MSLSKKPIKGTDAILNSFLSNQDVLDCISTTKESLLKTMKDRKDLHKRSVTERFNNILMGELAETLVLKWLISQGINAVSAVDKNSGQPDSGYDIIIYTEKNREVHCSVKSSLSVYKSKIEEILDNFTISTTKKEVQEINIQVYFWYILSGEHRVTLPSEQNMAVIGWAGKHDLTSVDYGAYATEERKAPKIKLRDLRPMSELIQFLRKC
ncbi:hypothetical protein [Ruminococcus flavefaciens]|uniref:hypothetical protein n=1 Tax=Ruminococcus flavefaciens TaxID=1265 RepID=UPI0004637BC7|nr:hypothetical protein [Ruminococcus flavefaciens]